MWQSIPRTGSLLLRASRPHSIQRFTRCLLSSLHALLPASSVSPLPPLSSLHASLPALSGFPLPPLLPPCCSPCVQRFPAASSPPTMPRSLHPAFPPLPPLSSLHVALPASSGLPAVPLSPPTTCHPH